MLTATLGQPGALVNGAASVLQIEEVFDFASIFIAVVQAICECTQHGAGNFNEL